MGSQTWAYDIGEGAWHQRMAQSGGTFTAYPTAYHTYIAEFGNGQHITGGPLNGTLYESSVSFYDDAGADIKWQRALPHLYNAGKQMYFGMFRLEMETGTTPSGTPTITLDYSDNRGHTFTGSLPAPAAAASAGTNAQYSQLVSWFAGGSSRDRVYRLTGQGQYRVALIDAELDVEMGVN